MTHKQLWKFLQFKDGKIVSDRDSSGWEIGEWREVTAPTELCRGLNACYEPLDALGYVAGSIIAKVEYRGETVTDDNKVTAQYMRIVTAWHWEKKDSVMLAVYSAGLSLKNFEQQYPNKSITGGDYEDTDNS